MPACPNPTTACKPLPLSAFQPELYEQLLAEKVDAATKLLAPFDAPPPLVFPSAPQAFRARAEFRVWHDGDKLDYVMFRPADPRQPVAIDAFPYAIDAIQDLMWPLLALLRDEPVLRRKLFQVEFLSTLAGDTLITLIYHRKLDETWQQTAVSLAEQLQVSIVGRSRKQKLTLQRDYVTEELQVNGQTFSYRQYEQAFSQPNPGVNTQMIEWACAQTEQSQGDLLELYCGNGNFTLPLARQFRRVLATELSKVGTRAARENAQANGVENLEIVRLSAEEVAEALAGTRQFRRLAELQVPLTDFQLDTVFVDPPRAGLDPATERCVANFQRIVYISCNPNTLAANLANLSQTHRVAAFAVFDQFPYTGHTECGVVLER